jgi:hypothetical protein
MSQLGKMLCGKVKQVSLLPGLAYSKSFLMVNTTQHLCGSDCEYIIGQCALQNILLKIFIINLEVPVLHVSGEMRTQ